jgi:prepilin-type N-terminal cleavage/methylation domain-containing protein
MRRPRSLGFSLLELIIAISLIALLVGVVGFRGGAVVEKGKVSAVVQLAKSLESACTLHHADTGALPREYAGSTVANRQLTATQTYSGWAGPYLERPLSNNKSSNPYGNLNLYNTTTVGNWIPGFDTDADGTVDVSGAANMLLLTGIDEAAGEALNDAFDRGLAGDWRTTGRVRWDQAATRAYVLIYR